MSSMKVTGWWRVCSNLNGTVDGDIKRETIFASNAFDASYPRILVFTRVFFVLTNGIIPCITGSYIQQCLYRSLMVHLLSYTSPAFCWISEGAAHDWLYDRAILVPLLCANRPVIVLDRLLQGLSVSCTKGECVRARALRKNVFKTI